MKRTLSVLALVIALLGVGSVLLPSEAAAAQYYRGGHHYFSHGYSGYGHHPYGYRGYGGYYPYGYAGARRDLGSVRIEIDPKDARGEAQVYVNEAHVGDVDDFDGFFQRLTLEPGEYVVEIRLDGYQPFSDHILVSVGRTYNIRQSLKPLTAAEPEMDDHSMMEEPSMGGSNAMSERDSKMKEMKRSSGS